MSNSKKIVLLGSGGVGKTAFVRSIRDNGFPKDYVGTVGAEVHPDIIDDKTVTFWDVAGQEKYQGLKSSYIKDADICILFFDLTHKKSYRDVHEHYVTALQHAPHARFILVGSKSDLPRVVEDVTFHVDRHMPYVEISAKTRDGIQQLMDIITQNL